MRTGQLALRDKAARVGDYLINLIPRAVVVLTAPFPLRRRSAVGGWVARQIVRLLPSARARIETNLKLIFPGQTRAERTALRNRAATSIGRTLTEIMMAPALEAARPRMHLAGPGVPVLDEAREAGRGVIIVSGHFGQWEAARIWLKAEGMETAGVFRPNNNPYFDADFVRGLEAHGAPMFPRGARGMRGLVQHLRKGGFAALLVDQAVKTAPLIDFMGHPAHTSPAAAELALRYKVPFVPCFVIRRDRDDAFDIIVEEPIPAGDPMEMMAEFNRRLEARIRSHPEQWHWLHRRWKLSARAAEQVGG